MKSSTSACIFGYKVKTLIFFLLILWLSVPYPVLLSAAESDLKKLTPSDNDIPGWGIDDTFYAEDADSLMARINGGAPFYLERGAQEVLFLEYRNGKSYLSVELYKMDNRKSARSIYVDLNSVESEQVIRLGDATRYDGSLIGTGLVEFINKDYFVRLIITQAVQSKQTILEFTRSISDKIDRLE